MRLSNRIIPLLFIVINAFSCIEPFTPGTADYEEMLLIVGLITDSQLVFSKVTISRTVPLNNTVKGEGLYESGAIVSVVRDDGITYLFTETQTGIYEDIANTLTLEEGKRYKLLVHTIDGEMFESGFESYKPSPVIDSMTYTHEMAKPSEMASQVDGLQFYAHATGLDETPLYLRWILDATYKYYVPFWATDIWDGSKLIEYSNDTLMECWKDVSVTGIFIGDSYGLTQNKVMNARLNFVSQFGDQLMAKYSLHAIQLSISESSYKFWYNLNKLINETGGLYETQPFRLEGNIHCTTDPDIHVTGVFEVAGVTELRVFAERPTEFQIYYTKCKWDTVGTESLPWSDVRPGSYIYRQIGEPPLTGPDYCFDCTLRGGTNIRPPFWE